MEPPSWDAVLKGFQALVGQESFLEIQFTKSIDQLEADTKQFKASSSASLPFDGFKNADVVVGGLKAFASIASALAPTNPELGSVIWGSTRLIFVVRPLSQGSNIAFGRSG